jgi:hypothetical protein
MNNLMEHETMPKIPEISPERKAAFVERDPLKKYYLFCGDDRNLTNESVQALLDINPDVESAEFSLRYYGGLIGVSRVLATTIAAQYGIAVLESNFPNNNFVAFASVVNERGEKAVPSIIMGAHSAAGNEQNKSHLDEDSDSTIGCAYAAGTGAVTMLSQDEGLIELGKNEQSVLFSRASDYDAIRSGNDIVNSYFFNGKGVEFGIDRDNLIDLDIPVAILDGSHAPTAEAVVVLNYTNNLITHPRTANEHGVPFYNIDVTQVAELLLRSFPDLDLDPRLLLEVVDQDVRATREALAGHEGKHAQDLHLERLGDAEEAILYLQSLKKEL